MTHSRKWYKAPLAVLSIHVFSWIVWIMLPTLFRRDGQQSYTDALRSLITPMLLFFNFTWIVLFYTNSNLLIPRLLYKLRTGLYISILLVMLIVFVFVGSSLVRDEHHKDHGFHRDSWFLTFPFLLMWALSTVFRFVTDRLKTEQLIQEKENENLKTELAFLRSQVSPHFLFNVLNNMVGMARLKSNLLEPSLIRLADLMRYMLYESDDDRVPLSREIDYVRSYIELQRIRFSKALVIHESFPENEPPYDIEPMLLIPFIENAFKHGTGLVEGPVIDVNLHVEAGWLTLMVRNKFEERDDLPKDKTSGIGLANVRRRLNLLYGPDHVLKVNRTENRHEIELKLKLGQ